MCYKNITIVQYFNIQVCVGFVFKIPERGREDTYAYTIVELHYNRTMKRSPVKTKMSLGTRYVLSLHCHPSQLLSRMLHLFSHLHCHPSQLKSRMLHLFTQALIVDKLYTVVGRFLATCDLGDSAYYLKCKHILAERADDLSSTCTMTTP